MNKLIVIFLPLISLSSCDPYAKIETAVANDSGQTITVRHSFSSTDSIRQTDTIPDGDRLSLYSRDGWGYRVPQALNNITEIFLEELTIMTLDSAPYNKDALNIDNWDKQNIASDNERGTVLLEVQSRDFD